MAQQSAVNNSTSSDGAIFNQNNVGVALLMDGEANLALGFLCSAFEDTRMQCHAAARAQHQTTNPQTHQNHSAFDQSNQETPLRWHRELPREHILQTLKSAVSNDCLQHGFFINHDSIGAKPTGNDCFDIDQSSATLTSAYVVFNLGLAYSILGNQNCDGRLIVKSSILFESCRRLLLQVCQSIPLAETPLPTENPQLDLLWLMTLTKLAEMNYLLCDFKQTKVNSSRLADFIRMLRLNPEYVDDKEMKGLLDAHCQRFLVISGQALPCHPSNKMDEPSWAPAA